MKNSILTEMMYNAEMFVKTGSAQCEINFAEQIQRLEGETTKHNSLYILGNFFTVLEAVVDLKNQVPKKEKHIHARIIAVSQFQLAECFYALQTLNTTEYTIAKNYIDSMNTNPFSLKG